METTFKRDYVQGLFDEIKGKLDELYCPEKQHQKLQKF